MGFSPHASWIRDFVTEGAVSLDQQILLILLGAAIALGAGVATTLVQHRLEARREKTRLWWERRVTAYAGVLQALHKMKRYVTVRRNACRRGGRLDEKTRESLQSRWNEGLAEVARATDMGIFYVNTDAVNALIGLQHNSMPRGRMSTSPNGNISTNFGWR